jgi:hypothetical protein
MLATAAAAATCLLPDVSERQFTRSGVCSCRPRTCRSLGRSAAAKARGFSSAANLRRRADHRSRLIRRDRSLEGRSSGSIWPPVLRLGLPPSLSPSGSSLGGGVDHEPGVPLIHDAPRGSRVTSDTPAPPPWLWRRGVDRRARGLRCGRCQSRLMSASIRIATCSRKPECGSASDTVTSSGWSSTCWQRRAAQSAATSSLRVG